MLGMILLLIVLWWRLSRLLLELVLPRCYVTTLLQLLQTLQVPFALVPIILPLCPCAIIT